MKEEKHTFKKWKSLGYHVLVGEKSKNRNGKGVPLFTEDQVESDEDSGMGVLNEEDFTER